MAGRPSDVSYDELFNALSKQKIFDSQGHIVVTKDDELWSTVVVNDLKGAISIKNLHTRFYGNRSNLQKNLKKHFLSKKSESSKSLSKSVINSHKELSPPRIDTIDALDKLKAEVTLNAIITDISAKPFHVIYVTPDQVDLYKDYMKFNKRLIYFSIYNNLLENAFIYNRESNDVLLYCLFGEVDGTIIPFFQTLSERCNKDYMSYSIGEFLRRKVPVPCECVTECSLDLLEGLCVAFNHQGVEDYCENCFEVLIEKKKLEEEYKNCCDEQRKKEIEHQLYKVESNQPACVVRIDMKYIVQHLKMLVDVSIDADKVALKDFYFDCLLYLCTLTDYEKFDSFIRKLFIILYTKKYDKEVEQIKNSILEIISLINFTEFKKNVFKQDCQINKNQNITDFLSFDFKKNKIYVHLKKIQLETLKPFTTVEKKNSNSEPSSMEKTISSNTNLEDNPYRDLNFLIEFTKFLTVFPVYTKIIKKCEVEGPMEYDDLKNKYLSTLNNVILERKEKIPVDSFICKHIQNLLQQAEECRSIFNKSGRQAIENRSTYSKELIVYELLDYRENWMGKSGGTSKVKEEDECQQEQAEIEFENELLYIKTMLDQSIVSNEHSYCIVDHSIEDSSVVPPKSSTPKTKKGIYTNPCPNLDLMYSKPDSRRTYRNPVMVNGNTNNPRSKNNKKYKLESTSLFDVMVEIFVQSMGNYSNFYKFLNEAIANDKKKECFLSIVYDHALQRDTKKFNTKRFHFIFKNGKVVGDRIFCDEEIQFFFNKIMDDKYGLTVFKICKNCNTIINKMNTCCVSDMPVLNFLKSTEFDKSEQNTILLEKESIETCITCKEYIIQSYDVNNYLAITVKDCDIEICKLKETVHLNCKRFILTGVIESIPTKIVGGQSHYVAYCRSINGEWQVRDNKKTSASTADVEKKMKIIFILYVHVE